MSNIEIFNQAFCEVFGVSESELNANFDQKSVSSWDSVHQLNVVAQLEDAFDLMLDPEDIMKLTSYEKGKEILKKYDIEL